MSYRILLAEDDEDIVKLLKLYLENERFSIACAKDGIEALDLFDKAPFDLCIVDIMMPRMNGYELTKQLRKRGNTPILILSAAHMDSDKILGLNLGADDYMVKPFNPLELTARINALLRRAAAPATQDEALTLGELKLDSHQLTLTKRDEPIQLTATEYKMLVLFMKNPGRVFTKLQLYEEVNGGAYTPEDNSIMVHISNLRDKIEDDPKNPKYIKTVRGLGYKIERL